MVKALLLAFLVASSAAVGTAQTAATVVLAASATTSSAGQNVTFTCNVSAPGAPAIAGTATFLRDGLPQAHVALSSQGASGNLASWSMALPPGTHSVTCSGPAAPGYTDGTSQAAVETIAPSPSATYVVAGAIEDASQAPLARGTLCFTPIDGVGSPAPFQPLGGGNVRAVSVCRPVLNGVMQGSLLLARSDKTTPVGINYAISLYDAIQGKTQAMGSASITGDEWDMGGWAPSTVQTGPLAAWVKGDPGTPGAPGTPGTTPQFSIGTVTTLAAGAAPTVSVGGTATNPVLNLGLAPGPAGATPQFSIGSVTTGAAGSAASVSMTGTTTAPVLNITIPQGPQGATGAQGQQGPPGSGGGAAAVGTANVVQASKGDGTLQADSATTDNPTTHAFQVLASVAKLPKIDVTHSDFGAAVSCANAADPTGAADSTCAIKAALAYSYSQSHATFGGTQGTYYPVYLPCGNYKISGTLTVYGGQSVIADARSCVTIKQTAQTASAMVLEANPSPNSIGTADTVIGNINFAGSGHNTIGSLLEVNIGFAVLDNLQFYDTAGRGLQINNAERVTTLNPAFSYTRWPLVIGGDANESYFYNLHSTFAQQTDEPAPSGSKYSRWCYGLNCITTPTSAANSTTGMNWAGTTGNVGALPAGGSSASAPNLVYPDPYGAIYDEKTVNVLFEGGTDKINFFNAGFRSASADLTSVTHMYMESSNGAMPYGTGNSSYIAGGSASKTFLTGPPVAISGGYETNNGTLYSAPVNDVSWQPFFFGTTADALLYWSGNYNPYVIIPQDYDPTSSAASAYATGLNKNQYERVLIAGFTGDGHMIFNRGQYDSAEPASIKVPANYSWPSGSMIEDIVETSGTNSLKIADSHLNNVQTDTGVDGNSSTGYYKWAFGGEFPGGEIVAGIPGDTVALNANPALNKNGWFRPYLAPGSSGYSNNAFRTLVLDNNENTNSSTNVYVGSINSVGPSNIVIAGEAANPNAVFLSSTASQAAVAGRTLPLSDINGGGFLFAPVAGDGSTVTPVFLSAPNYHLAWDSGSGFTAQFGREFFQSGTYRGGIQFQNSFSLFDTPATGGQPANECQMQGAPFFQPVFLCQSVNGGTNTPWFSAGPGGFALPINGYTTAAAFTMPAGLHYIQYDPRAAATLTLPQMAVGVEFNVMIPATSVGDVTLTAALNSHGSAEGLIQSYGVNLGTTWTPAGFSGNLHFLMDGANYQLLTPIGISGPCVSPKAVTYTNGVATSCQ